MRLSQPLILLGIRRSIQSRFEISLSNELLEPGVGAEAGQRRFEFEQGRAVPALYGPPSPVYGSVLIVTDRIDDDRAVHAIDVVRGQGQGPLDLIDGLRGSAPLGETIGLPGELIGIELPGLEPAAPIFDGLIVGSGGLFEVRDLAIGVAQ